jgi:hypothetical protein
VKNNGSSSDDEGKPPATFDIRRTGDGNIVIELGEAGSFEGQRRMVFWKKPGLFSNQPGREKP